MVWEAVRGYLALASGLTEISRQRAVAVARSLLEQAEAGPAGPAVHAAAPLGRQVQHVADDLLATARENREQLRLVVRGEVDRAVTGLGLAHADELAALRRRVAELERQLAAARDAGRGGAGEAPGVSRAAGGPAQTGGRRTRAAAPRDADQAAQEAAQEAAQRAARRAAERASRKAAERAATAEASRQAAEEASLRAVAQASRDAAAEASRQAVAKPPRAPAARATSRETSTGARRAAAKRTPAARTGVKRAAPRTPPATP